MQIMLGRLRFLRPRCQLRHGLDPTLFLSKRSFSQYLQSPQQVRRHVLPLLATSALLGASTVVVCYCEQEESPRVEQPPEDEEDDPYENLPEEDEETDCVMCRTFRQGPCGPTWRKLERCFKDHETSKASKCTKYFMGHQECLSGYLNLYQLISLDLKQELVRDTASAITDAGERFVLSSASIDWTPWRSFCKDAGPTFRQSIDNPEGGTNATVSLWKRFPPNTEPVLVATEASLPTTIPNEGASSKDSADTLVLKYAYAVDQDGWTVGLSYHDYYGHLVDQSNGASATDTTDSSVANDTSTDSTTNEPSSEEKPPPELLPNFQLEFYIIPSETRTIELHALYAEDPTKASASKKLLDVKLGSSALYNLQEVAEESS